MSEQPLPGDTWVTPDGRPWFVICYGHDLPVIDDDLARPAIAGPTVIDVEGTAHRFQGVANDCGGLALAYRPKTNGLELDLETGGVR